MFSNFKCVKSDEFGRYLISEKHFNQGDVVWEESPLVSGPAVLLDVSPDEAGNYHCVSCYKKVNNDQKCPLCQWPCCSEICSQSENHQKFECKVFSALEIEVADSNFRMLIFMRMLLCKDVDSEKYDKFLTIYFKEYEEVEEVRKKREKFTKMIWKFLAEDCQMKVSMEEVSQVYSAIQINKFEYSPIETGLEEYNGEACYVNASLFAHSCQPNLMFSLFKTTEENGDTNCMIRFKAREEIEPGEMLTIAYSEVNLAFGTIVRRHRIFNSHNFFCMCSRCKDNTEGGTYFQAMVCPECDEGNLLPEDPIEISHTPWSCDKCDVTQDADTVMSVLEDLCTFPYSLVEDRDEDSFGDDDSLGDEVEEYADLEIDEMEGDMSSVELADKYIETKIATLHPNHFLMNICAMHWLLECDFIDDLLSTGEAARSLFAKIIKRVNIYVPLCLKFMPFICSVDLLVTAGSVYAAYALKCDDLRTFVEEDFPVHFKLRMCRRIASFIKKSLFWKEMHQHGIENKDSTWNVYLLWSKRVAEYESEIMCEEQLALTSIRFLF